jgi:hypothetical protein
MRLLDCTPEWGITDRRASVRLYGKIRILPGYHPGFFI